MGGMLSRRSRVSMLQLPARMLTQKRAKACHPGICQRSSNERIVKCKTPRILEHPNEKYPTFSRYSRSPPVPISANFGRRILISNATTRSALFAGIFNSSHANQSRFFDVNASHGDELNGK